MNRSWTLSLAKLKTRAAETRLPAAPRGVLDQTLAACDALAGELAEAERTIDRLKSESSRHAADYDQLLQRMPVAAVIVDEHGQIVKANAEAATVLNVSVRSLPDRLLMLFVEDRDTFHALFDAAAIEESARTTLLVRPRERAPVEMDVQVVRRSRGEDGTWYCFFTYPRPSTSRRPAMSLSKAGADDRPMSSGVA